MSATTQCDRCKTILEQGDGDASEPWLNKYGDMLTRSGIATGGVYAETSRGQRSTSEEERTEKRGTGEAGYGLNRGADGLVSLWVRWRDSEDYCRSCVEAVVLEAADAIRDRKAT